MEAVLASIIGALVSGAVAKAGEVGGKAIADAYEGLKSLIVQKLGKGGAVQSVEDEPRSEPAQAALAVAMAKAGVAADSELASKAKELEASLAAATASGGSNAGDIDVGNIHGKVNAVVERLVATGHIKLGDITAETGDARLSDLTAGGGSQKKA
jgi:aryl-alcohol dehydrogenase-like predicted oxidoreductase